MWGSKCHQINTPVGCNGPVKQEFRALLLFRKQMAAVVVAVKTSKHNICITFIQRWPDVFAVGPILYKCHTNLGIYDQRCLIIVGKDCPREDA